MKGRGGKKWVNRILLQLRVLSSKQLYTVGTTEKAASSGGKGGNFFCWIYHQLNSTVESKTFSWNEFGLKTGAIDSRVSLEIYSFHFSNQERWN